MSIFSLDDCIRWQTNVNGDCGGAVEVREDGKILCENCHNSTGPVHTFEVQVGKGSKGSYKPRYMFKTRDFHSSRAWFHYSCINIGNGYKKRLVRDGQVIARCFS